MILTDSRASDDNGRARESTAAAVVEGATFIVFRIANDDDGNSNRYNWNQLVKGIIMIIIEYLIRTH